jgi:ribonuclease HI
MESFRRFKVSLLENIHRMNWEIQVSHAYRKANNRADAMANMAWEGSITLILSEHRFAQISSGFFS